jgi:hypothetical protein
VLLLERNEKLPIGFDRPIDWAIQALLESGQNEQAIAIVNLESFGQTINIKSIAYLYL